MKILKNHQSGGLGQTLIKHKSKTGIEILPTITHVMVRAVKLLRNIKISNKY